MHIYSGILGSSADAETARSLHQLEHGHAVDEIVLSRADLSRRRLRASTRAGHEVAIALSRDDRLFDGAVLALDSQYALVVRVEAERWLQLRPIDAGVALALGYHAGNLHWRVRFADGDLLVAVEAPDQIYLDRLENFLLNGRVTATFVGASQ